MKIDLKIQGKQIPKGKVCVSGAKNSATRLLAASLVSCEPVRLRNFPTHLVDAQYKVKFMQELGAEISVDHESRMIEVMCNKINLNGIKHFDVPIRTTYLLAAGQLLHCGEAKIPYPGGCKIGARGYDLHIMVWKNLGCDVIEKNDHISIKGSLQGGSIDFPISTVGGTENALICASIATGTTEIRNAYITPEVEDLISMLRQMGASIESYGNSLIRVSGASGALKGASHSVISDRIEALTWIIFGIISGGEILVENVPFAQMEVPLLHLQDAGIDLFRNSNSVYVSNDCVKDHGIQPFELACGTHPGIISDMQSFYTLLGMKANGISRVFDYRYPERIAYAQELNKFCQDSIKVESGKLTIKGSSSLKSAIVKSTDLRGSMSLIMAAFCAEGESYIEDVQMAMRGYSDLFSKLRGLGLNMDVEGEKNVQ